MSERISGAELMREIDASVLTWCSQFAPGDETFHGAILDPEAPTDEELDLGWTNFFEMEGRDPKHLREIVFRRPTWDHIPEEFGLRAAPSRGLKATGLPFQPFEHWRFVRNAPKCVLRSNWVGAPVGGRFRLPGDVPGRLTERLGEIIVLLVDRFGDRPNWRGYTHIDEMKADARIKLMTSLLKFSPLKSSNPLAYAAGCIKAAFIDSKKSYAEGWSRERYIGDAEIGESGEGLSAAEGETWTQAADREFDEAEAAFLAECGEGTR